MSLNEFYMSYQNVPKENVKLKQNSTAGSKSTYLFCPEDHVEKCKPHH